MSKSSALTKAKRLKAVMLDYGVPEVSIELQSGRPNPYDAWDGLFVVIDMSHHIVSNYNPSNLTPLLWLVKQGRTSVPGPLANGYGGWDLCYRILCFSYANHPGAGGPMTVPRAGGGTYTIPKDSARRYAWGTEYEGGVVESDWDRLLRNPRNGRRMTMREFMGRAGAALHDYFNISFGAHAEHSTWAPLRKIDRLRYSKNEGAAEERRYADAPPTEDDMPYKDWPQADKDALAVDLARKVHERSVQAGTEVEPLGQAVGRTLAGVRRIEAGQLTPAALAAALAPLLPSGSAPTQEQLEAALTNVLGSLDNTPA